MTTTLFGGGLVPGPTERRPPKRRVSSKAARAPEEERPSLPEQQQILEPYSEGKLLQAYDRAKAFGPLTAWRGTSARILAGRLAAHLGASRLGHALHLRAARLDPLSPIARYYAALTIVHRQGPVLGWTWMKLRGEITDGPADCRADWLALEALVAARLRDFETAWGLLRRAEDVAPMEGWRLLHKGWILEQQDDYDAALQTALEARRLDPTLVYATGEVARFLRIAGRDDEATAFLERTMPETEWAPLAWMLASLLEAAGRFEEGLAALDRYEAHSPLLERAERSWLAARRCDLLYAAGDFDGARRQAELARSPFHAAVAQSIAQATGEPRRRVQLDVPFVQQRHKTCSPASLASLSRYWRKPLDQDDLADAMSYDGTPQHAVRTWGAANGWVVREFRITWDSARALLDRGVPFGLSTAMNGSAHQQVVVGYDTWRRTFTIRCPSDASLAEALADPMLEHQQWYGPVGLLWLPPEEEGRLEGIDLPDAPRYDDQHALHVALLAHRRPEAAEVLRTMQRSAPGHPLTLWARLLLAGYDGDSVAMLEAHDALVELFPEASTLHLGRLSALPALSTPEEYGRAMADTRSRFPRDPSVELTWLRPQSDRHLIPEARRVLRLLLRTMQSSPAPPALFIYAYELERAGQRDVARQIMRFAVCVADKDEGCAQAFFAAFHHRGVAEEGLSLLRKRFEALAPAASGPALTLVWALQHLERGDESVPVLEKALSLRPDDADLKLAAVETFARRGDHERASSLLEAARGRTRHASWLRIAAALAASRDDRVTALRHWNEVLEREPWAADANYAVANLLWASKGQDAAASHFASALERFPRHQELRQVSDAWTSEVESMERVREANAPDWTPIWWILWAAFWIGRSFF